MYPILLRTMGLAIVWTMFAGVQGELKMMLLHNNDMHSKFVETDGYVGQCRAQGKCYGGFARVRSAVEYYRKLAQQEGRSSLFLNAGDTYYGTILFTTFKWKVVSQLVNMMDIDVMSLGNHEFDNGPEGLEPFLVRSNTPVVCANIDVSEEPILRNKTSLTPSKVLNIAGVKVGVIGYLTPETKFLSRLGNVRLEDEVQAIRREAQRLTEEGVKVLIALGHSGYSRDKEIAEQVPQLDIVVGGHTDTFLYNGSPPDLEKPEGPYPTLVTQPSGRKVLVVQAYAHTKYLGVLRVTFDDQGEVIESSGNPVLLNDQIEKNLTVDEAVSSFTSQLTSSNHKVGFSRVFLEAKTECKQRECNFGNLLTDAMVFSNAKDFLGKGWTDAPIAFVPGGSIRAPINPEQSGGEITYSDILSTLPHSNSVERLRLNGSTLRKVIEHSVARYSGEERPGSFLQYSGIKVVYDVSKPPQQRVLSALVRCGNCSVPQYLPLVEDQDYTVLTISYLAGGGNDYKMLKEVSERVTMAQSDVDAVVSYLSQMSPVYPEISGRIKIIGNDINPTNFTQHYKLY